MTENEIISFNLWHVSMVNNEKHEPLTTLWGTYQLSQ